MITSVGKQTPRLQEIDFLKAVLIILMVTFHLVFIGQKYPYAKQVVYTFHMPVFLLLSGYLMKIDKPWWRFCGVLWRYVAPYAIMESGYILMASLLPINEHIGHLSLRVFAETMLLSPIGPYWYLHTLIICGVLYYLVYRCQRLSLTDRLLTAALLCFFVSSALGLLNLFNALFFFCGAQLSQARIALTRLFQPSAIAAVPFLLLSACSGNLTVKASGGVAIALLSVNIVLFMNSQIHGGLRRVLLFVGRNTLPIFLFSPIFTLLCKSLVPYFQADATGLLFIVVAVLICVSGSLAIGKLLDVTHLSSWFFGRERFLCDF
jgi:fucose 4-O-acetylase-like acetyltransferase